jgi:hypothetical protein
MAGLLYSHSLLHYVLMQEHEATPKNSAISGFAESKTTAKDTQAEDNRFVNFQFICLQL